MIIIKIWGGLGNQLFQYSFGYALSKKYNDELFLDTSFFKKHQYSYVGKRFFELHKLNCDFKVIDDIPFSIGFLESFAVNRIIQRYKGDISFSIGKKIYNKEKKKTFMSQIPYQQGKINYYDGYWQSSLYFSDYKDEIQGMLKPSFDFPEVAKIFVDRIKCTENSVSVHIRKGDFSGKVGHAVENDYYINAVSKIREMIDNPVFFVFSDDINWVKNNIDFGKAVYFADYRCDNGPVVDLICMNECNHGIMSASTFSWWGNWFKDGIVVVPSGSYFNNCFLEKEWIQL